MKKLALTLTLIVLTAVLPFATARAAEPAMPGHTVRAAYCPIRANQIESYAQRAMVDYKTPGLILGVVMGDTLVFAGYYGYADLETGRAVDETTIFRIGSISKSVSAIGLMQQWEQGKFALDDNVNDHLPEPMIFPPHPDTKPVTFRHLLTHTSGGGEILSYRQLLIPNLGMQVKGDDYRDLAYYLRFGMKTRIDPGLNWAYSNFGFGFLGLALESIAGQEFNQYMIEHVFKPLGMNHATYQHDAGVMEKLAPGYKVNGKGEYEWTSHRAGGITSAGNIYCNLEEFALYAEALLNGGKNKNGKVIEPETLKMMMSAQYTLDPRQKGYGFAFHTYGDVWGHQVVGHSGSVPFGYASQMLLVPDKRLAVITCANSMQRAPIEIAWGVLKRVLDVKPAPELAPHSPEVWPELEGLYGPIHHHLKVNARLIMDGIGNYEVKIIGDDLNLIHAWQGDQRAKRLHQVKADDPYFYRVERDGKSDVPPSYIAFEKDAEGRMTIIPGGLNRYQRMTPARAAQALLWLPTGRLIAQVNPF